MDPIKAASLGVDPNEIHITCEAGRYSGAWIVWVPDPERGKCILTSGHDLSDMCWWRTQLHLLVGY